MNVFQLPIYENKKDILYLLENFNTLILIGHTGCGKTTQIPKFLYEAGYANGGRLIVCTQPRRISTISVAERVSKELNKECGDLVGYSVRFDEKLSDINTRIKYTTDGMLIREMMIDPLLARYSVIMIDEAHERSLNTDLLFGLLKKIQHARQSKPSEYDPLKLIISSATLQVQGLQSYFGGSKQTSILTVSGDRNYPVDILYLEEPCSNYYDKVFETVIDIHFNQPPGDILVFLTGQEEIDKLYKDLGEYFLDKKGPKQIKPILLKLYSSLSIQKQMEVFENYNIQYNRKIILSTNIAETSVTIDGIVYVVDCGFVKVKSYSTVENLESLVTIPISKSSADQRSGRAGRNRYGKCFRLYTQESYQFLNNNTIPEISRSNLTSLILQLKSMGIDNIMNFQFLTEPPTTNLVNALDTLYQITAIDEYGKLTPSGSVIAEMPLDPQQSKILLTSEKYHCTLECTIILSMLSLQSSIYTNQDPLHRKNLLVKQGDHFTLLNIFQQFQSSKYSKAWCKSHSINYKSMLLVIKVKSQLMAYLRKFNIQLLSIYDKINNNNNNEIIDPTIQIRKSIISGYFNNIVTLQPNGTYKSIKNPNLDNLHIHPNSVLSFTNSPQFLLYNEIIFTTKKFIKDIIVIEPEWLLN